MGSASNYDCQSQVLVVDPDAGARLRLSDCLTAAGCAVIEAADSSVALNLSGRLLPDVIVIGWHPAEEGIKICGALRALPGGTDVPILLMTDAHSEEIVSRACEAGATDFISRTEPTVLIERRVRNLSRASRALKSARTSEARLAIAQRLTHVGTWEWDVAADELFLADEVFRILSLEACSGRLSHRSILDHLHPQDRENVMSAISETLTARKNLSVDFRILKPDGLARVVHAEAEITLDETGHVAWLTGTFQDVSERKQAEERIRSLALYDSLTGLPSHQLFKEQLEHSLAYAERNQKMVATLFLNLDRFKYINDTLGHGMGDKLLRGITERVMGSLRKADFIASGEKGELPAAISRLGGDEFTIFLADIVNVQDVVKVARRLLDVISQPFALDGQDILITASIGISLYPIDATDGVSLIKNADTAMYHAKDLGRNNFQFYSRTMNASAFEHLVLETQLRRALERGELLLHYQPQIDIRTGCIVGVEALVRWQHPDLGMVSPADFISVAEETGLIIPIDEWVLKTACRQNKAWQKAGLPPIRVAVNLSGQHFRRKRLVETVTRILANDSGLEPCYLELELTEGVLMRDIQETIAMLNRLKEMGVSLSIDDFGTGYSSLNYLKRFPLHTLKIDQSFVGEICTDDDSAAITRAIIAMAHSLKLKVIAEGVETEEQLAFLRELGCEEMQGYLFSRPLGPDRLAALLAESPSCLSKGQI